MATIVISGTGTHGDHLPYIALGAALRSRGHRVKMAFRKSMHSYVLKAGLEAIDYGQELTADQARQDAKDWDHWEPPQTSFADQATSMEAFLRNDLPQLYHQALAICADADLFIGGLQRHIVGSMLHHKLGLPWVAASVTPFFLCTDSGQPSSNQRAIRQFFLSVLEEVGQELGLEGMNWLDYEHNDHALLGSSQHFSQPTLENAHYQQMGFWFYEDPAWKTWQPDPILQAFVEQEPKPLFLSFSSIPVTNPRAVLEVHVRAAAKLGRRLLVHRGWANFNESLLPDDCDREAVMFVDFMPQDWILSHAAAFLNHGGVGSIARSLRNDCPMLIEPLGNDQFFNAKRILALQVGAAAHPHKITPDSLAKILENKVLSPSVKQKTQALGAKMRTENGAENACKLLESWLS
nr:glycosyltransferase [Limnothrix sp. FACHB-881]